MSKPSVVALAAVTSLGLVLAACSPEDSDDGSGSSTPSAPPTPSGSTGPSDAVNEASYPVTFTTPWGESTLKRKPTRIASLGYKDADVLAALGETPVLMADSTEKQEAAYTMKAMPGTPEATFTYDDADMAPLEQVAKAKPDLIVASNMDLSQNYDKLSAIAPVIAAETVDDLDGNWQQTTTNLGRALGRQKDAAAVIDETARTAADIREQHPEFAGKSISLINYFGLDRMLYLNSADSDLAALMDSIGFEPAPNASQDWKSPVSEERISDLESDVIVVIDNSNGKAGDLENNPQFRQLTAAQEGNVLVIHNHAFATPPEAAFDVDGKKQDGNLAWAVGYPGPLSTWWELTTLAPLLGEKITSGQGR
jgi:iron complex transport system substrate-binding protein